MGRQQPLGTDETDGMTPSVNPHHRHRFPAEIINHAVWLYTCSAPACATLILGKRGVAVSYDTVRRWCKKFAASFADACDAAGQHLGTSGTCTKSSSASRACSIIWRNYGVAQRQPLPGVEHRESRHLNNPAEN